MDGRTLEANGAGAWFGRSSQSSSTALCEEGCAEVGASEECDVELAAPACSTARSNRPSGLPFIEYACMLSSFRGNRLAVLLPAVRAVPSEPVAVCPYALGV